MELEIIISLFLSTFSVIIELTTQLLLFLKRHLDNLINTSMACQGLCRKIEIPNKPR